MAGTGRRLLDDHSLRHRRAAGQDVPDRLQRHQRPHHRRKRPGTGRLREDSRSRGKPLGSPAPSPTTRGTARASSPSCAARSWPRPAFTVYFLDGYRSTPELSFTVRYKRCDCGIMITASHNPPTDNAVKVYWSTAAGNSCRPTTTECIDCVQRVTWIKRMPFAEAHGGRQDRLLPGGGRRGVRHGRVGAERARAARPEDPLFAAARRGRVGRLSGAGRGRLPRRGGLRPARRARRRFPQRAQPRRQSGEPRRLRRHDRARPSRSAPT